MRPEAGLRLPLVALLATLGLSCCPSSSTSTVRSESDAGAPACPVCSPSQVCFNGACYDTSCADQQCPPDAVCTNGQCVPTSCLGVSCPPGSLCAGGACQPTSCGSTPCSADQVCYDGSCVTPDCFGVLCPSGYLCAQGQCEPTSCGSTSCDGGVCSNGACIQAACFGVTCPTGQSCANGGCWLSNCPNEECPSGDVCSWTSQCISAACAGVSCPAGYLCAGAAGACQPTSCGSTPCASGEVCGGSTCVSPDCFGVVCPSGFLCAAGNCTSTSCGSTQCGIGDVCDDGGCTQASCVGISCPSGEACGNGSCYPATCPNQWCPPPDVCPTDQCEPPCCAGVTCPTNSTCAATCQCEPSGNCPTGWVADDGGCIQAICDGVECPPGQSCANGACNANGPPGDDAGCPAGDIYLPPCVSVSCADVCCPSDLCTELGCSEPSVPQCTTEVGAGSSGATGAVAEERLVTAPLDQVENNYSLSVVSWPDGGGVEGIEIFARTTTGSVNHARTENNSPVHWYPSANFSGTAGCGPAAVVSFVGPALADVFNAPPGNQVQTLSYDHAWSGAARFGGQGFTQLSTLRWADDGSGGWNDGRVEVFALDETDHRIHHKYFEPPGRWSAWVAIAGTSPSFATGVSAILDAAGNAVIFGVDKYGKAWFNESNAPSGSGWRGWQEFPGGAQLSTRPVVVRDAEGTLRVFARGMVDKWLQMAKSTTSLSSPVIGFSSFTAINAGFQLAGEPSAAVDNGTVTVFVRDMSKHVSYTTMNQATHGFASFKHFDPPDEFVTDPFAWKLPTGRVEVFAINADGKLFGSYHTSPTAWTGWGQPIASNLDISCIAPAVVAAPPACPNGDGLYCGGHGVGGTSGDLYNCTSGDLVLASDCTPNGCEKIGKGGADICGCNGPSDCPDSCAVCVEPSQFCGGGFSGSNYCDLDINETLAQPCSSNADCDPCQTGTMACTSCADLGCDGGKCCQTAG